MASKTEHIRTIALLGHGGAGKTTLTEALLHKAGAIPSAGSVERGNTVSDSDPLEKAHQHSVYSACCHFKQGDLRVHLIDAPGYPDFAGQALIALPAVETAAIVVNAQNGIEMMTKRQMQWAEKRKLCRIVIINKIDAENVNPEKVLADVQESFGRECLPLNLPADGGTKVVDCFFNPSGDADFSSVAGCHQALIDQVVEVDEALMSVYLEKGEVSAEELHAPFEKALREGHLIPVCFVSARTGAGVPELFQVINKLLPNPTEGNPPQFVKGEGESAEEFHSTPDPKQHVLAHVFKITIDPFVGKIASFRVHQGTLTKDSQLYVGESKKSLKPGHLYLLQGKDLIETPELVPGDIGAVAKIDDITFDAVLHDSHDEDHIHLRPLELPRPMAGLAIAPKKRGDEQRISEVLHRLQNEDVCFKVEHNSVTHETVIYGLGEQHLRLLLEKMANQYKLEIDTRPPRIPYRETIAGRADGHHRHKKQTGGAGQFGEVYLRVEPLPRGTGFEFSDDTKGGVIPNQFMPAVEKGIQQVLEAGPIGGFPLQDVRVSVYDGKHHAVDSKEVAFVSAGKKAFLDALAKAKPQLLEPIVSVEIVAPEHNMGDITGDLSSRRGQVQGTDSMRGGMIIVRGQVPLAEINSYQTRLKSVTGGQGSYSLEFSHFEPVPPQVQQQIAAAHKSTHHDDE